MSEQVRLSDEERETLGDWWDGVWDESQPLAGLGTVVERILAARLASESRALAEARERLAACERLADAWGDPHWRGHDTAAPFVRALRAALGDPS